MLLSHFITSEVVSVIPDKTWIILPEDYMVDVYEYAYQIALVHIPGLCFINLGPSLAAGTHIDYEHRKAFVELQC